MIESLLSERATGSLGMSFFKKKNVQSEEREYMGSCSQYECAEQRLKETKEASMKGDPLDWLFLLRFRLERVRNCKFLLNIKDGILI